MRVAKICNTKSLQYPKKVVMTNGVKLYIPQQKRFNKFSKEHGCSLAAVSIALQLQGIKKNPTQIYAWAKKHISGYTGSKLTIYGACKAINGIAGKKIAKWYPIDGKCNDEVIRHIREMIKSDAIVLIEQTDPIHTNVLVGSRKEGGSWNATNGMLQKTTVAKMVKAALQGYASKSKQLNWYKSGQRKRAAGYVVVTSR